MFRHRLYATMLLAVVPTLALATPPTGRLDGLAQHANTDVRLSVSLSGKSANFHFDQPFACDITANYLKEEGDASIYRFNISTNGGSFCDGLKKDITFKPMKTKEGGTAWAISFSSKNNDWTGELSPVPSP